jgi:hypothetical protein
VSHTNGLRRYQNEFWWPETEAPDDTTGLADFTGWSPRPVGASVLIFTVLLLSWQLALAQLTQQGPKLVGTGVVGSAEQGFSVAVSADGNTAIVGGPADPDQLVRRPRVDATIKSLAS